MRHNPKNILITGGAGFIGSHFILYLMKRYPNLTIVNFDKLTYAANLDYLQPVEADARYHFVKADICDRGAVFNALSKFNIDTIVHFAAESHVDQSIEHPLRFLETNIIGTQQLLDAARDYWQSCGWYETGRCRFHHISTDEVYGSLQLNDSAFVETSPYKPNSPYSASKASSDHLVRAYHHTYGMPVSMTNCSNNYGLHQHSEKFIPTVIQACITQRPIGIYGDGSNIRDWLHVDDHCAAIDKVVHDSLPGSIYNVGGDNEWTNLALAKLICNIMDSLRPLTYPHADLIQFVKDRPGHDWRYAVDSSKLKQDLLWEPQQTFKLALTDIIQQKLSSCVEVEGTP